jgi:FMN phosphatase YigB (HAD superfamily)
MQVIKSHKTVYFDVDETLILWEWRIFSDDSSHLVCITDPDSGVSEYGLPHNRHIDLMRQFKARGHTVVVWSAGGYDWAHRAVVALGIEAMVDVVMSKPDWYVDDIPASAYMKKPIYLHPMNPLKDERAQGVDDED